jgi:hypothetical protein
MVKSFETSSLRPDISGISKQGRAKGVRPADTSKARFAFYSHGSALMLQIQKKVRLSMMNPFGRFFDCLRLLGGTPRQASVRSNFPQTVLDSYKRVRGRSAHSLTSVCRISTSIRTMRSSFNTLRVWAATGKRHRPIHSIWGDGNWGQSAHSPRGSGGQSQDSRS